ncbi:MAG: hypothetical protein EHM70_16115 [Chloroflexota bacterium]|nr:MAG: hypothetical protein EHM70_16115 [Chloroflexota bacterium]
MHNQKKPDKRNQEDLLVEFTDRILAASKPEEVEMHQGDPELVEYEKMVVRVVKTYGSEQPGREAAARIRAELIREWRRSGYEQKRAAALKPRWFDRIRSWQPATVWGLAAVAAIMLAAIFLLPAGLETVLPGTALADSDTLPFIILGLLVVVTIAAYVVGKRKR